MNDFFHGNVEADPLILPKEWGGCLGLREKISSLKLRDWTRQRIPRLKIEEAILCKLLYICEKNLLEHS